MTPRLFPPKRPAASGWLLATALAALGPAVILGLTRADEAPKKTEPPKVSPEPERPAGPASVVTRGNAAFAVELHRRLVARNGPAANEVISPYGLSTAMAMAFEGAAGTTAQEIARTFHYAPDQDLARAFAALNADLTAAPPKAPDTPPGQAPNRAPAPPPTLLLAHAVWLQKGFPFTEDYLSRVRAFGATTDELDFHNQTGPAVAHVNQWVNEHTKGKIPSILKDSPEASQYKIVLTNAVYFNGLWDNPFEPDQTRDAPFHTADGKTAKVPMMANTGGFPYEMGAGFQVVELPFKGRRLSLVIVLPDKADGLPEVEKTVLTPEFLLNPIKSADTAFLNVAVPRFKLTVETDLKAILKETMPAAFSPTDADFSRMTGERDLMLSAVLHRTYLDVREDGVEAAAATAITGVVRGALPQVQFRADHPFVFFLRDRQTGTVLFLGRFAQP